MALTASEFMRPTGMSVMQLAELGALLAGGAGYDIQRKRKRHGGTRTILVPELEVNAALKLIRIRLEGVLSYEPHDSAYGYIPGRGILGNASTHLGQRTVLTIDLDDFFGGISASRVQAAFEKYSLDVGLIELLLPVVLIDDSLPAGFSTSPYLSNVVFEDTDQALSEHSLKLGMNYSRYADDITFSAEDLDDQLLAGVTDLLMEYGWSVNHTKTRFMRRGGPQYVTGLYVGDDDGPHVPRRMKRQLRQWFHYIRLYGYDNCDTRTGMPSLAQLSGWLRHLHQVEPAAAEKLLKGLRPVDAFFLSGMRHSLDVREPGDVWDELLIELGLKVHD